MTNETVTIERVREFWDENPLCASMVPVCQGTEAREMTQISTMARFILNDLIKGIAIPFFHFVNEILSLLMKNRAYENSVLHISYMVHIPHNTVKILREHGMKADYMAIGSSPHWDKADYKVRLSRCLPLRVLQSFVLFWSVVSRYEIIHSHFMIMFTERGWELPLLKRMGRKIVIHYRGCEIRNRTKNMALHPVVNICSECDYDAYCEKSEIIGKRRQRAQEYGDLFLVTTPDLKDFAPDAIHLPFFTPEIGPPMPENRSPSRNGRIKIVHVTNHPGIEGTAEIEKAIGNLKKTGYDIDFVFLSNVPPDVVLSELATADLSIGKMKMGYYANAQIESMLLGVPSVTYVRPEFVTDEIEASGLILTTLYDLEGTLRYYLDRPEELLEKKRVARRSILELHDNDRLANRLIGYYRALREARAATSETSGKGHSNYV